LTQYEQVSDGAGQKTLTEWRSASSAVLTRDKTDQLRVLLFDDHCPLTPQKRITCMVM